MSNISFGNANLVSSYLVVFLFFLCKTAHNLEWCVIRTQNENICQISSKKLENLNITNPLMRNRSLTSMRWGEVKSPVRKPHSRKIASQNVHVEPWNMYSSALTNWKYNERWERGVLQFYMIQILKYFYAYAQHFFKTDTEVCYNNKDWCRYKKGRDL